MKKILLEIASALAATSLMFAAAGCSTARTKPPAITPGELADTLWKPSGSPPAAYVEFTADNRVLGCAGTNRYFGPVTYAPGKRVNLGPLATTRAKSPYEKYERSFFSAMEETRGYVLEEDKLTLYNEERQPVLELRPVRLPGKERR